MKGNVVATTVTDLSNRLERRARSPPSAKITLPPKLGHVGGRIVCQRLRAAGDKQQQNSPRAVTEFPIGLETGLTEQLYLAK